VNIRQRLERLERLAGRLPLRTDWRTERPKRNMWEILNLRTPSAREIFRQLVRQARDAYGGTQEQGGPRTNRRRISHAERLRLIEKMGPAQREILRRLFRILADAANKIDAEQHQC